VSRVADASEHERAVERVLAGEMDRVRRRADRLFVAILVCESLAGVLIALWISPHAWSGRGAPIHAPLVSALVLGAAINALPIALLLRLPGATVTRHAIAVAQMSWSAVLVQLTDGHVDALLYVFGSLVFLAAYRDALVLLTASATAVIVLDYIVRDLGWPEAVFGIADPDTWLVAQKLGWLGFMDVVLVLGCRQGVSDLRARAEHEVELQELNHTIEKRVLERTAELEASRERYRTLAETTSAVPWELDPESGVFDYIGPQVAPMGYPMREWMEPGFYLRSTHPDDRYKLRAAVHGAAAQRADAQVEYRVLAADGTIFAVRSFLHPFVRRDGRIGVRGVSIDVSETKKLELELRQAQKLESVGRLASGIAHEINTPTQFVSDNVHFARDAVRDVLDLVGQYRLALASAENRATSDALATLARRERDADLDYVVENLPSSLDRALEGLDRISAIVRSMKEFAHPDRREKAAVDLNRAVTSTLTIARHEYKYVADAATDLGELPPVLCYAGELNQVILNLVVNSAHAIAEKVGDSGERGTIRVATWCEDDHVVLEISDTGTGIPDEIRERIFDPFFTTKEIGKGTGQGLAIARSVVEKHGGTIECSSTVGVGTCFRIRLPVDGHRPEDVAAHTSDSGQEEAAT
jgi:PAS domain S-box-containing protein